MRGNKDHHYYRLIKGEWADSPFSARKRKMTKVKIDVYAQLELSDDDVIKDEYERRDLGDGECEFAPEVPEPYSLDTLQKDALYEAITLLREKSDFPLQWLLRI